MQTNYIIETSGEVHLKTQEKKEEEEGEGEGPFPFKTQNCSTHLCGASLVQGRSIFTMSNATLRDDEIISRETSWSNYPKKIISAQRKMRFMQPRV